MQSPGHHHRYRACPRGFSLVAVVSVMVLLLVITLGMLSLSSLAIRNAGNDGHRAIAEANARLALMQALGELQKYAGPDQRVTARAAILEKGATPLPNRNWLGVWATSYKSGGKDWPVIGKKPDGGGGGAPYSRTGAYEDLRHTVSGLSGGAWREKLRLAWLVSRRGQGTGAHTALSTGDRHVVEMVGKGTLGKSVSAAEYARDRVLVEKVNVGGKGAYAWYVSDNNQKASLDPLGESKNEDVVFEAFPRANPALVKTSGATGMADFTREALEHDGKMLSYQTAALTQQNSKAARDLLARNYHHFTGYAPGLFVDTMAGGLKYDLTPLLLASKGEKEVEFSRPGSLGGGKFSSSWPIIPGSNHGVLGPSFAALRNWAQHAHSNLKDAEASFPPSALRMRPAVAWPHNISDGACADAREWAASAPKIHPVMTECRWHYYFSHHNKRIRAHIIPRVCLWNPYNRELHTPVMTVLMPNLFYGQNYGMHFIVDTDYVDQLKKDYKSVLLKNPFLKWKKRGGYYKEAEDDDDDDEEENDKGVYKLKVNPFPKVRYLAFTLEPTTLAAGECHVFSPKVNSAGGSAGGGGIQAYQPDAVSQNLLSSSSDQGRDHFYFDHEADAIYQVSGSGDSWVGLGSWIELFDMAKVIDYQPEVKTTGSKIETFPFVLKAGSAASLAPLYTGIDYPTLQLIYGGAGGAHSTSYFNCAGIAWGSAKQRAGEDFGDLPEFSEASLKDPADTHQVGVKMLWLNEDYTEGASNKQNMAPLRGGRWEGNHMVYNVAPVANWNVRAQLATRSPASQCARRWFMHSMGLWINQFVPYTPQNLNDVPRTGSGGAYVKNPFGAAVEFSFHPNVILFDLPSEEFGVLSVGKLRHAMLSPYSWSPSYVVGHSLRDMHAPSNSTAFEIAVNGAGGSFFTVWDSLLGKYKGGTTYGAYAKESDSQGLLQIGNQAVTKVVDGTPLSSRDDTLAYDIAYEVNHNLWDRFYFSGMPLDDSRQAIDWGEAKGKKLWNTRYQYNPDSGLSRAEAEKAVAGAGGLGQAFWRSAEFLKNKAAFNVNSTSVQAWTAFLSGSVGTGRPLQSGNLDSDVVSFSRYTKPGGAAETNDADPEKDGGWTGARQLSDDEVRALAENIVLEVRKRGPFVSMADFVNRRLRDADDETSHMGTLDAAIKRTGLNEKFYTNPAYQTTTVNSGGPGSDANRDSDNNHRTFRDSYRYNNGGTVETVQPDTQAWGLPGFLTQGDLLEPLAPAMTVRGDTFTVRAYGESSEGGVVKARAWLEVIVERTPAYVQPKAGGKGGGNEPADAPLVLKYATGEYTDGSLSPDNKRYGRKFRIKSFRWLSPEEI